MCQQGMVRVAFFVTVQTKTSYNLNVPKEGLIMAEI